MSDDRWAQGRAYEQYMGRWSRLLAVRFVEEIVAPPSAHWLDVGCGTGALTQAILDRAAPASVTGCDGSPGFIVFAQEHLVDPRARFEFLQMPKLPVRDGGYDIVASSLVLNFLPSPEDAVRAMAGVAAPGGLVAATVWDYAEGLQFVRRFWDAVRRIDPAEESQDEAVRFPICAPERLASLFVSAGLVAVQTGHICIDTPFRDFGDYWQPFLGGVGPAGTYVARTSDSIRDAIASSLESSLPRDAQGAIPLTARAFVVTGRV